LFRSSPFAANSSPLMARRSHLHQGAVMMPKQSYKDLVVWQKAMDVTVGVYQLTAGFPKHELYGLTSQMRRAAASIPANIAEGRARKGEAEFGQFLYIAAGSLAELETYLDLTSRLGYADEAALAPLSAAVDELDKILYGLIRALRTSRT
jgi:four helix bundle protein